MFLYPKVATKQIPIAISTQPESLQCVFIVFEKITLRKISDSLRLGCVKTRTPNKTSVVYCQTGGQAW